MNRSQLEHVLRAAGAITRDNEFIVIGSQSLLGAHPDAPPELQRSMDADLYPKNRPEESILLDGAIGEGSMFHQTFGYYAHGVGPETAVLPQGWQHRLVAVCGPNTQGTTGWCLDPADLVISKLVADRETDHDFVRAMLRHSLVNVGILQDRLESTPVTPERRLAIQKTLASLSVPPR